MATLIAPQLGEIRRGWDAGKNNHHLYIWHSCISCGRMRWVTWCNGKPKSEHCIPCANIGKGGRGKGKGWKGAYGYLFVYLKQDDFFYPMAHSNGCVLEHRLVMAKHLGRCLQAWEVVHHLNHKRDDNQIENLKLASDIGHKQLTLLEARIKRLEEKVGEQGKLIKLLQWQLKQEVKV